MKFNTFSKLRKSPQLLQIKLYYRIKTSLNCTAKFEVIIIMD